ncbi:MAG TPA: hypothetical protein VK193_11375 [Methyloceanibacter sp.]|jgi:hypothetical protein|nr:hypothetical protein [Methyloceanibacter sp.]
MEKLARSAALVSVLLTGVALAAAPAEAAQYRFLNGQFQNQNFVDNCPGNPRPAACRPKKPAAVKPLPYFKPPAYVLSGQYKTHPRPTGYIGPHYQSSWGPGYHTNWPGIGLMR